MKYVLTFIGGIVGGIAIFYFFGDKIKGMITKKSSDSEALQNEMPKKVVTDLGGNPPKSNERGGKQMVNLS